MVRMNLREMTIYKNKKSFIDRLSVSPYVKIEGSVSSSDVQEINDMFSRGPIYLMTEQEADEYMVLKQRKVREAKEAETKEEENNEKCD